MELTKLNTYYNMTPVEKAKELMDRMINTEHCGIKHFPNTNYCDCTEMNRFQSIQCALIAIDEILDIIRYHGTDIGKHSLLYWVEVKNELENL